MFIRYEVQSNYLSVPYYTHTVPSFDRAVVSLFVGIPGDTISSDIHRVSGGTSL